MAGATIGGAELARLFYDREVRPLLDRAMPDLPHAAARLGSGSDVLGLDDARSQDHDWGCRLTLLVADDHADHVEELKDRLEADLSETFLGHPVRFTTSWDPRLCHKVEVATVRAFACSRLGVDALGPLTVPDWLVLTGQAVLEVVAGPVFADDGTGLGDLRERLRWYPDDVWHYVVAAGLARLAQELPLLGRAGERGDALGSRLLCARLCRDLVHLSFLLDRRWPPYPKWVGTAFVELPTGSGIAPNLAGALAAETWREAQAQVVHAARVLHQRQLALGLTAVEDAIEPFWDRPYLTVADSVARSILERVVDPDVRALPPGVGSIEQWVDNVDVLTRPDRRLVVRAAYVAMMTEPAPRLDRAR